MKSKYVVIDLETTGNNPKNGDRIIQIAAIVIEHGKIVDQYSSYINPGRSIPLFIQELTGISEADVEKAPTFKELAPYIIGVLDEAVFVAHNVLFDLTFLQAELERVGYERFLGDTVDTVELAKIVNPEMSSFKLEELGKAYGFLHDRPHQADSDAYVTALLFLEFYTQLKRLPKPTIKSLYRLSFLLKSELKELLAEIIEEYSTVSEPWRPDLDIYRGIAITKEKPIPHLIDRQDEKNSVPLDEQGIQILKNTLKDHKISLVEDGTNNFAGHLKAVFEFASENKAQVTIAMHSKFTIKQVMDSIYSNHSLNPIHKQISILHSKEQYLSLPKFEQTLREKQQNYESTIAKMQLLVWLTMTNTGCLEELNLSSGGKEFWKEVSHHASLHPRLLKPWTERDFYTRQIMKSKQSRIILTTHKSLVSDIQTGDFLSSNPYYLIEEATYFPSSVQRGLTKEMSYVELRNLLNKIGTLDNRQLLRAVTTLLKEKTVEPFNEKQVMVILEEVGSQIERFFETLFIFGIKNNTDMDGPRAQCKLDTTKYNDIQIMHKLKREAIELYESMNSLLDQFHQILSILNQIPIEKLKRSQLNMIDELTKLTLEMSVIRSNVNRFFKDQDSNDLVWMNWNLKGHKNSLQLYARPLSVAKWIQDYIIQPHHTLFLSDVLTVEGSFYYISRELGVLENSVFKKVIPPLKRHYLTILPEINGKTVHSVIDLIRNQQNHLILLFHSQESMKKIYNEMKGLTDFKHIQLQAQGLSSGSAIKMLRNHLAINQSILLMTFSGWNEVRYAYDGSSRIIMVEAPVQMNMNQSDEDVLSELIINLRSQLNAFPDYDNSGIWVLLENELIRREKEQFKQGLNYINLIYKNK